MRGQSGAEARRIVHRGYDPATADRLRHPDIFKPSTNSQLLRCLDPLLGMRWLCTSIRFLCRGVCLVVTVRSVIVNWKNVSGAYFLRCNRGIRIAHDGSTNGMIISFATGVCRRDHPCSSLHSGQPHRGGRGCGTSCLCREELVENAIDAGATRIDIRVSDGGRLIIVVDDGRGMRREDALAVERHATSELPDDDVLHISFWAFRGSVAVGGIRCAFGADEPSGRM